MIRVSAILGLLVFAAPIPSAHACSCDRNLSISDLDARGATVLLASPVGKPTTFETRIGNKTTSINVPTRFKVWKSYIGDADDYETIDMSLSSSCAISFPLNHVSMIVAYRREGQLSASYCSAHQFSRQQLLNYFERGIDTMGRDACFKQIFEAYKNESLTGEFRLENEQCLIHKSKYDAKYRVKLKDK